MSYDVEHCTITNEAIDHIGRIAHLEELVLGRPLGYSEVPSLKTQVVYSKIMHGLKNLKKLEMP
jgi:hypothetical protein